MELTEIGKRARTAEPLMRKMEVLKKNQLLLKCAEALIAGQEEILAANALDMEKGRRTVCLSGSWTG